MNELEASQNIFAGPLLEAQKMMTSLVSHLLHAQLRWSGSLECMHRHNLPAQTQDRKFQQREPEIRSAWSALMHATCSELVEPAACCALAAACRMILTTALRPLSWVELSRLQKIPPKHTKAVLCYVQRPLYKLFPVQMRSLRMVSTIVPQPTAQCQAL